MFRSVKNYMSCRAPTIEEKATKEKNRTLAKHGKTESDMGQNECKNFSTWASLCTRSKPRAIQAHFTELRTRIDITLSHSFRALTSIEAGVN
jgi:hypothetical protein